MLPFFFFLFSTYFIFDLFAHGIFCLKIPLHLTRTWQIRSGGISISIRKEMLGEQTTLGTHLHSPVTHSHDCAPKTCQVDKQHRIWWDGGALCTSSSLIGTRFMNHPLLKKALLNLLLFQSHNLSHIKHLYAHFACVDWGNKAKQEGRGCKLE